MEILITCKDCIGNYIAVHKINFAKDVTLEQIQESLDYGYSGEMETIN